MADTRASGNTPRSAQGALAQLLEKLFRGSDIRVWAVREFKPAVTDALPGGTASPQQLATSLAQLLEAHGLVKTALDILLVQFPLARRTSAR
jgi:hypothetical protein